MTGGSRASRKGKQGCGVELGWVRRQTVAMGRVDATAIGEHAVEFLGIGRHSSMNSMNNSMDSMNGGLTHDSSHVFCGKKCRIIKKESRDNRPFPRNSQMDQQHAQQQQQHAQQHAQQQQVQVKQQQVQQEDMALS